MNAQPVFTLHESTVQLQLSLQTLAVPPPHLARAHFSPMVQALPSSHTALLTG